jgi:hypothetical protein
MVNNELYRIWKKVVVAKFVWYYPGIRLEGLKKTTMNLSEYIQSPGRDLKPGLPESDAGCVNHSTTTFGGEQRGLRMKMNVSWDVAPCSLVEIY